MTTAENSGNVVDALKNAGGPGDHLWEDNWDDDDIEDDFTKQLRWVLVCQQHSSREFSGGWVE